MLMILAKPNPLLFRVVWKTIPWPYSVSAHSVDMSSQKSMLTTNAPNVVGEIVVVTRAVSSVGRASGLHSDGRGFESLTAH